MTQIIFTYSLQFDNEKFMITKRLYNEIISETNLIGDYGMCRVYVKEVLNKCQRETKKVLNFEKKKIDIEI